MLYFDCACVGAGWFSFGSFCWFGCGFGVCLMGFGGVMFGCFLGCKFCLIVLIGPFFMLFDFNVFVSLLL